LYLGKKVPVNAEKGFFQKYGTILMIGGFFIFNMFVQRKARSMQSQPAQAQSARRQTRQAEAVSELTGKKGKKSGATVEELPAETDGDTGDGAKPKKS